MRTDLADLGSLLWLRVRQWRGTARRWLVYYDRDLKPGFNRTYAAYLIGLGFIWVFMMWAFLVDQAADFGLAMGPTARAGLLPGLRSPSKNREPVPVYGPEPETAPKNTALLPALTRISVPSWTTSS